MVFGYLNIPWTSIVLPYDDEKTPLHLTGIKMLPIFQNSEITTNESLIIIKYLDKNNQLYTKELLKDPELKKFEAILDEIGSNVHSLAMPYWIYTPEFNDTSRKYFQNKKEKKRGPFKDLVTKREHFITGLNESIKNLSLSLNPYYLSNTFRLYDVMLASHLWGMYVVPEFQFEPHIHDYLQRVKELTKFNYHQDFWK